MKADEKSTAFLFYKKSTLLIDEFYNKNCKNDEL